MAAIWPNGIIWLAIVAIWLCLATWPWADLAGHALDDGWPESAEEHATLALL